MKKLGILMLSLFVGMEIFGQEKGPVEYQSRQNYKHEVRLGVIKLIAGGIFEAGYEYVVDVNQGFGANILIDFNRGEEVYFENLSFNPYYRRYFNKLEEYGAKGLFAEGFLNIYSGTNEDGYYRYKDGTYYIDNNKYFETALGMALGSKWVSGTGFVLEVKAGIGRNLMGNSYDRVIFKGDLSIGYRFLNVFL